MQIDWFTFGAQIVNFVVLVALLKRFLYGPILAAMDEREARIAERLAAAHEQQAAAQEEAAAYRAKQAALEAERTQRLAEAEQAAAARRDELLQAAREEVQQLETEWRAAVARQRDTFLHDLAERALHETIEVARRALRDLADADLEARAVETFIGRLEALDADQRAALADALRAAQGHAVLRSAFAGVEAHRDRLREVLAAQLGAAPTLTIEPDAAIGFGLELRIADRKVAWSLDSYLGRLVSTVRDQLQAEWERAAGPASPVAPAPAADAPPPDTPTDTPTVTPPADASAPDNPTADEPTAEEPTAEEAASEESVGKS